MVGILDPESFFEREIARLTASLVETGGGLIERSVVTDKAVASTICDSYGVFFVSASLYSLLLSSTCLENGRSSSEAERLIWRGRACEPDQVLVNSRLWLSLGEADKGDMLPEPVSRSMNSD